MARLSALLPFLLLASCASPARPAPLDIVASDLVRERDLAREPGLVKEESPVTESLTESQSQTRGAPPMQEPFPIPPRNAMVWRPGQSLAQGFLGVSYFQDVSIDLDGPGRIDGDEGDLDELPVIGGGGQWKLGGDRIDFGIEGLLSFSGRADAAAFVVGGGGAAVAVNVDLLIFELYGGPFASMFLGEKARVYGAAGPLLQWANYNQSGNGFGEDGSGFGAGYYARTGIEFVLPSRTLIGFGARWSDSSVDLGGNLGDLEIDGLQVLFTVSRGL